MATTRLRFVLDGDDHLSPVLTHAGDSSARLHRRLNDDMDGNARAVRGFTQDADGRFRDLRGRFLSVADAQRMMAAGIPVLTRRLGDVSSAGGGAASSLGQSGGGLGGSMVFAAAAGASLLPALGALVPMMAGLGLAAGTLKLGFSGIAEAVEASGKKAEDYQKALDKLPKPAREFTKELVSLKKEFSGVGKEIQKAMLPGFTKALKDAEPVLKTVSKAMVDMGGAFGDAAKGVGKLLKDSGFQADLQANLKLGAQFVRDMTSAMGPFVRSLLDFGAASGPTLKAFSDGIGGLLSKGLPGMFEGLKPGIGGAASMLNGLFSAINGILPAIGRLAGEMGKTLGPVFGDTFKTGGTLVAGALDLMRGALEKLRPVFKDIGYGFQALREIGTIVAPTLADTGTAIASAFLPIGDSVKGAVGPLQNLKLWVDNNRVTVLETAREFGVGMIMMTSAAIQATPVIIKAFRYVSMAILGAVDVTVSAAAKAFGWVPGIGDKLKAANRSFDKFRDGYISALDTAEKKASEFAASATPKLSQGRLKLNINNWTEQIAAAKAKLSTVPPSKQAALKATIKDLQNKVAEAKRQLNSLDGKTANTYVKTTFVTIGSKSKVAPSHRNYATGGTPKAGQLAMVGEEGPELVVFGQDARVFDADETKSILHGTTGTRTIGAGVAAAQGLIAGMTGATGSVGAAARSMAASVTAGVRAELEIASPSKKMQALAKDIGAGLIKGLTGSRDKIKSTAADLAKDIRAAFSGKKESGLLRMVDQQTKKLLDLQAKRDKIAASIAAARQFASGVTQSAREGAGLSSLGMEPDQVTAGGIKAGLAGKLAQIKQFTSYIGMLAKKGLSKDLLRQILNMGPDAGYAYASALVGADKATFGAINSLQKQIGSSSDVLGRAGADALYDSGRNASRGFLAGLQSQQKDIEKLMLSIAKAIEKSIRKALGIRSPSTVMARLGAYSTEGLARGLVGGVPVLDRALGVVSGRVAATQPVLGRPAVAGAGGGHTTINLNVDVRPGADAEAVWMEIRRGLLSLKRTYGKNLDLDIG